jgi:uracil-DNA glycosylase
MNESHLRQILRMWLQTDVAFGAAEVPIRLSAARAVKAAPSTQPAAFAARQTLRSAGKPAAPPGPAQTSAGEPIPGVNSIPPIPDGLISALTPLSAEEKKVRLAELAEQAAAELGKYLSHSATKVVFGEGDPAAALMFVGEGPGAEEDRLGRPFVGRSGQLLDKMIVAMGLRRTQVYIGNVVKLRAADPDPETGRLKDRPPTISEAALGLPWLHRQIEIIRPAVIVTLGASAIRHLIGETENMTSIRGRWRAYRGIPVMPTYHPSFLLRAYTPENRGKVWSDLKLVLAKLGLKVPSAAPA